MNSKSANDFLNQIDDLVSRAKTKTDSTRSNDNVTFNMRINEGLRADFDKLCRDNHTNMTAEVKRFIRLAVEKQKI